MKNSTQTLKRNYLFPLFLLFFAATFAQNAIVGTGFSSGWGGGSCPTGNGNFKYLAAGAGSSYGVTTIANGTGDQFFRFGIDWSGTTAQRTITIGSDDTVSPNTKYTLNPTCTTSGAMKYNVPNASYNYVFKTLNAGTNPTGTFVFFEVQGDIRSVATVTQFPLAANAKECLKTTVTATLNGALATGQTVYMRYTKDGYATSTVVPLIGSAVTYTGTIPSDFNTAGATVSYYVFTSGTTTPSGADADLYTINLNNNAGSNYSYTVAAGGATTAIPDSIFEQALIDLGYDCSIDGQVFTNNISGIASLDISDRNIPNLSGIEAFSSLQDLYCANNSLSGSLNLTMFPSLRYIDLENNALTNLNTTGLTNLVTLVVWTNNLTSLDLSTNTNLSYLDCDDNDFTALNVSALTNLNQFYCSGNALTSLDVRGLTNLVNFECKDNSLLTDIFVDNVEEAITKSITDDPTNVPISPYWAKPTTATYTYCKSGLTTTWTSASGGSWTNDIPTSETAAIISFDYNQSANIDACTLTINNNANVTIPSGFNVTLNAPITVTSGSSFTLSSNANLIQTNKQTVNSGNINVNRETSLLFRLDYTMWSSPVTGTQTLGNFSPLTDTARFYVYNSTSNLYNSVSNGLTFTPAKGYLIRMPNNWVDFVPLPGTPAIPLSWTGTFTGIPNNGDFSYSILNGEFIAVGNPYPSTLNIDQFISVNNGQIDGTLWFWRKTNDATNPTSYSTCNTAGCTLNNDHPYINDNFISVGQGFIVKASSSGNLKFTNTMRVANTQNQFFKTKKSERNRIWLNLSKDTTPVNQMLLAYMTGATQGIDQAIDGRYFNDSQTALNSFLNNGEFAIQGRALPFDGTDVVPLAFKTTTDGNFTIAIDHVDGLFSGSQDIYLVDSKTGTETNLKTNSYQFTATTGVDNSRFSLTFQKTLSLDPQAFNDNSVIVYKNNGVIYVNSGAKMMNNIKVFDIQGRLIAERNNVKANTTSIQNLKASNQLLIVQVTNEDNQVISKKVEN
jgi:hypothetical protein